MMIPGLLDYVKANYKEKTAEEMAEHLGTSKNYIEAVCYHNRLNVLRQPQWTDREIEILELWYPELPWPDLFDCLPGRSEEAIRKKAAALGLSRRKYEPVNPEV